MPFPPFFSIFIAVFVKADVVVTDSIEEPSEYYFQTQNYPKTVGKSQVRKVQVFDNRSSEEDV